MKLFIILVCLLVVSVHPVLADPPAPPEPGCDRVLLREWLLMRRGYLNATLDVLDGMAEGYDSYRGLLLMEEHALSIFQQPRPTCADNVMQWTWYLYVITNQGILCTLKHYGCSEYLEPRLQIYIAMNEATVVPLYAKTDIYKRMPTYYILRPDGWARFWSAEMDHMRQQHATTDTVPM